MKRKPLLVIAALTCSLAAAQNTTSFTMPSAGEAIAEITASAPSASWEKPGAESSLITLTLDGVYNSDVMLYQGATPWTYRVFLGPLPAGAHQLVLARNAQFSAAGAGFELREVKVRALAPNDPDTLAIAHAPILYARADTLGRFSDVPLLMWYERLKSSDGDVLQYSMIFTNEDGGTQSDALMARWGRGTDIEYMIRLTVDDAGNVRDAIYQAPDHKDLHFRGRMLGQHPILLDATLNNTFMDVGSTAVQYRLVPVFADLSAASRESVMDKHPWTYRLMAEEFAREGKLRQFGEQKPPNISDFRNYLYLDLNVTVRGAGGVAAWAKRKGEPRWFSSHRGRPDFAINRNDWVRTTIELPPGTSAQAVEAIAIECLEVRDTRTTETPSECTVQAGGAFLLGQDFVPGQNIVGAMPAIRLRAGEKVSVPLGR